MKSSFFTLSIVAWGDEKAESASTGQFRGQATKSRNSRAEFREFRSLSPKCALNAPPVRFCGVIWLFFGWSRGYIEGMEAAALPRPDLAAHRRSVQASFAEIVDELAQILGKKLTAYICGVKDTRVVDRWI